MARKREVIELLDSDSEEGGGGGSDFEPTAAAKKGPKRKAAAAPKAKQPRAPKAPKKEVEEKRTGPDGKTVRKMGAPSQKVQDRIARALPGSAHRMFLVSTEEVRPAGAPGGRAHKFAVLGATGNVYDVEISRNPCCSCPDFAKGNLCKHILFVMIRALKLSPDNELIWQKALLTKEVEDVLAGHHSTSSSGGDVLASAAVRNQYARLMGRPTADAAAAAAAPDTGSKSVRRPVEGDCPVCFDSMQEGREAISWCASCGNNIHAGCCDKWANIKRAQRAPVTCCYCRAPWVDGSRPGAAAGGGGGRGAAAAAGGGAGGSGQYINLTEFSEVHRGRDLSLHTLYPETSQYITGAAWQGGGGGGARRGSASAWRGRGRRLRDEGADDE